MKTSKLERNKKKTAEHTKLMLYLAVIVNMKQNKTGF